MIDCPQARDRLLQADDPRPERCGASVAAHVAGCPVCQSFAAQLLQLQDAYRALPLPEGVDAARVAFLERLTPPVLPLARPKRRLRALPRWAAAAVVLFAIGVATWLFAPTPEAHAAPAVIERLVDWNLEMAQAATPAERNQLYAAREAAFREEVARAPLPPADQELAQLLLDNGTWLAANDDPMAAAERFSTVADKLVERMHTATERKEIALANRYARLQALVIDRGLTDALRQAEATGALRFDTPGRIERVILQDRQRREELLKLLESNPNLSRKDIRKALDIQPKTPRGTAPRAKS